MRRFEAGAAAALVLLATGCTWGGSSGPGNPLRIGVDLPLSGAESRAAIPALNGVRLYVETHPKLDGFDVTLSTADYATGGRTDPDRGAADVGRFVRDGRLVAMIGPLDGAVARKEIPVANAAALAMISPATSNPCLTRDVYIPAALNPARTAIGCAEAGLPPASGLRPAKINNFFRMSTTDDLQGAAAAEFAVRTLRVLRAAVVSDGESYGQGLAAAFAARFGRLGGTVVRKLDLDPQSALPSDFLKLAAADGAAAVYYGGAAAGCAIRARMAAVLPAGRPAYLLGGDAIAQDPACVTAASGDATGIYATAPIVDAASVPAAAPLIRQLRARFAGPDDYGPYAVIAYDATDVLYAALARAIDASGGLLPPRAAVTAEIARTAGFVGATGTLGFDPAGDTTNRVISIYEAPRSDPGAAWKLAGAIDYGAHLPY